MAIFERKDGFVRTIAPELDGVGEQAVIDSEMIDSIAEDPEGWVGQLIHGRYRLIRALGRGGMGTVYLAEAEPASVPPMTFAVKLLNHRYANRHEFAARFLLEAQSVSRIDHPNVVGVVDFGTTSDGATFLVMEHLRGESLELLCRRAAPLAWPRVRHLMVQVCRALQAAHDLGIIHRDLKPDNVLRMTQGQDHDTIKLLDFGLAKIQTGEGLRLTRTGMVLGTPRYMAPEQARGAAIDHRVDVYAAGIMIYELLCGRTPFQATTFMAMRSQHLLTKPEPPSHWAPSAGITAEMDAIALRALAKDPNNRFASMAELADAIETVGQGRGPVPLLERETRQFGLASASMIAERGRLTAGTRRPGELSPPAMGWVGKPSPPAGERAQPVVRRWPLVIVVLLGIGVGGAIVAGLASLVRPGVHEVTPTLADPSHPPVIAPVAIAPSAPASEYVSLTIAANFSDPAGSRQNVAARVLEARDQAIVGDTPTVTLPRSSTPLELLLRADGYVDLAFEVTPDRDLSLSFTLEPRPEPVAEPKLPVEPVANEPVPIEPVPIEPVPIEPAPIEPVPIERNPIAPELRDPFGQR